MAALASSANLADAAGVSEEGSSFFFEDDEKRSRNFAKFDMVGKFCFCCGARARTRRGRRIKMLCSATVRF